MARWTQVDGFGAGLRRALTEGAPVEDGTAEQAIADWLSRLRLLHGVPFHLLVPDGRMLPPESIRFFVVDENWLAALLDGAFSIGRSATRDGSAETAALQALLPRAVKAAAGVRLAQLGRERAAADPPPAEMSGFVLRSAIAGAWPGLEVHGYATADRGTPLDLLRLEHLAGDLLLCLFAGRVGLVTFSEPAETLHFGFPLPKAAGDPFRKPLKYVDAPDHEAGTLIAGADVVAEQRPGGRRVLDVEALAGSVHEKLVEAGGMPRDRDWTPAEFALEMVQGVQEVDYREGAP